MAPCHCQLSCLSLLVYDAGCRRFDADANGSVSFNELLVGLRGQLNERRTGMVRRAFKVGVKLDALRGRAPIHVQPLVP